MSPSGRKTIYLIAMTERTKGRKGISQGTTMPHLLTAQGMCDGGTLSHDTGLWKTLRSKLQPCVCPNCCFLCSHFPGKPSLPVCVWRLFSCVLPNHPHWFHCCHNITLPGRSPTVVVPNSTRPSDRLVCLQDGRQELPVKYSKSQLNSVVLSVQEKETLKNVKYSQNGKVFSAHSPLRQRVSFGKYLYQTLACGIMHGVQTMAKRHRRKKSQGFGLENLARPGEGNCQLFKKPKSAYG